MSNFKKILAVGLAATMVVGGSVTAFASDASTRELTAANGAITAAEQTVTGAGTENYISKKVFKVVVPTQAKADEVFDYWTDPQGLISETAAAAFGTDVPIAEDTGIFFKNKDEAGNVSLSSWSDPLKFVNKSTSGVKIDMKVKLVEASSGAYATGYSTTADFTGGTSGADKNAGMYLGLLATGAKELNLTATEQTPGSVAKSAYPLYAVTYKDNAYSFDIPAESVDAAPTYEVYAHGTLNRALSETIWYTYDASKPLEVGAALKVPSIEVKYTPTYIDAKQCAAAADADNIYIYNFDESPFTKDAAIASVEVNGKAVTLDSGAKVGEDGLVIIPMSKVYAAYSLTGDDATFDNVATYLTGVKATVGGVAVYANIDF